MEILRQILSVLMVLAIVAVPLSTKAAAGKIKAGGRVVTVIINTIPYYGT